MGPLTPTELLERRARLLQDGSDAPALRAATEQLAELFERVAPRVRRLDPAGDLALLERLGDQEPVNPVRDRADLLDRVDADRRCLVLEHPELPGVVLSVVWCALWRGPADDLAAILDPGAPCADLSACDRAVFYSIWNVDPGGVGLSGGRLLLEGAVPLLRTELPGLVEFLTLSPLPGFRAWFDRSGHDPGDASELRRCAARYLTSLDGRGRPLDPVARFHLGNGARLLDVHVGADRSELGRRRSHGVMANYRYVPEDRVANRAALAAGTPPCSDAVAALVGS